MSATARLLGYSAALAAVLTVSSVLASPHILDGSTQLGWLAIGQASQTSSKEARQVADQFLRQAREHIKTGDLTKAEYCIERAEKQNVKYDPLFARFKDTPAKLRKDLEKARQASGETPAASSPNRLARLLGRGDGEAVPPSDPYGLANPRPSTGPPSPNGATNGATGASSFPVANAMPANQAAPTSQVAGPEQKRSSELLRSARQALAKGDTQRASLLTAQARQLGLTYPLTADSPDKVDTLVQRARVFAKGRTASDDPQAYTRSFAQFLMDQSAGLLGYQAFNESQQLAQQANDLQAQYGQFDRTPQQLLTQIAAVRRQVGAPAMPPTASGPQMNLSDANPTGPRRLPPPDNAPEAGKAQAQRLLAQARMALDQGDLISAKRLADQARGLAPDSAYGPEETRPWMLLLEINKAANNRGAVMPAGHFQSQQALATEQSGGSFPVSQGIYNPAQDPSRNVAAQALQPTPGGQPVAQTPPPPGEKLYMDGLRALENHDRDTAMRLFREAWQYEADLDPLTRQQLQDKLILLSSNNQPARTAPGAETTPLEAVDSKQQLLRQKLYREISSETNEAQRMSASDPRAALDRLQQLRDRVGASELDPASKKQLLTIVDQQVDSLQQFIQQNLSEIELNERNRTVVEGVALDAQRKLEVQNKLATLVEEFNTLLNEHRYPEAEVVAKQAYELAPNEEVTASLMWKSRFIRRFEEQSVIRDNREQGFYDAMTAVEASAEAFDDREPYRFTDATRWRDITDSRLRFREEGRKLSQAEIEIERALSNKVDVKFTDRPLSEVMDILSDLSGVPIVLDQVGLAAEGVTTDTPVTLRLSQQISLRSALDLILSNLRLSFVPRNEVLLISSEQTRDSQTYAKVYNVGDLVIPIPNFVPGYNTGLAGAIKYAHESLGYGGSTAPMGRVPLTIASNDSTNSNTSVLAQMGAGGMVNSLSSQQQNPMGFGPGGMGGAAMADFDTLIELITTTIAPDSWDDVGGAGAIESFPVNLSLVISQTQEVHEQISDLLDQLRRLQDLQVTIEVRFITLNDNFFERIGIDFDFSIDDNVNVDAIRGSERTGGLGDDTGPSAVFGISETGPTTTLDLEFTQGSFGATIPQFGNFDAGSAANFGFAILSDLEVFFLLQASEGDQRTNVLQAPKVTLFNGQTASVMDFSSQPFVTSIIPVVGDFAAAQQPVIVVLNEGTQLNVQAVVSSDRRFVRLTLVPFFSRIGPVDEFTFEGSSTTDSGTIVTDPDTGDEIGRDNEIAVRDGTTVQLPTFIFTTVSTTVSVPDGGTVLLGGIKRLSEGRVERGVPMLSKMPYINRLFKNVGIGRETESLMMMVTPRIIIQEEEELNQTGYSNTQ